MRELSAEARLNVSARAASGRTEERFHAIAVYSALALIAAIVFGTISVHPL